VLALAYVAFFVVVIAGMWKTFAKAGQPGWAAIVPIYNIYVMLKIVGREAWWLILFFIPCVGFVAAIIVYMDLAKSFGKSTGFGLGLIFLSFIFFPILGFGNARYVGPAALGGGGGTGYGQPYGGQPGYAPQQGYQQQPPQQGQWGQQQQPPQQGGWPQQ